MKLCQTYPYYYWFLLSISTPALLPVSIVILPIKRSLPDRRGLLCAWRTRQSPNYTRWRLCRTRQTLSRWTLPLLMAKLIVSTWRNFTVSQSWHTAKKVTNAGDGLTAGFVACHHAAHDKPNKKKSKVPEFFCNPWDSNPWPLSHVSSLLTTAPHYDLCLYCISVPQILYQIMCKLIIWGPKWFQIKKLSTIKFHNFLGSTIFI